MSDWGRRESPGERIEIELTPVEARHDKPRGAVPPSADQPLHDGGSSRSLPGTSHEDGADHVPRRTLIVTAVAVGAAALVIGWAVGRSDDNATAQQTPTPTSVQVATTERITDTIAPPVTVAPPVTTARPRPSTTTTTTLPAGSPAVISVPPELRALPYELAVSTYQGDLYRIDFAAGTMRTYPRGSNGENYVAFSRAGDLVEFTPWDASVLRTIALDGSPTDLSPEADPPRTRQIVVDGVGTVWRLTADNLATSIPTAEEVSEVIQLPAGIVDRGGIIGDPGGGLLAYASGDIFDINPTGATRITTGEIMALGADTAIVSECDDALMCGYLLVDRPTGARQPILLQEIVDQASSPAIGGAPDTQTTFQYVGYWPTQATVAGTTAVFGFNTSNGTSSFGGGLTIIDFAEQRVVGVLAEHYGPLAISADGSWVFSTGNGNGLVALEVATGDVYEFGPNMAEGFNSIVVRTT